VNKFDRVFDGQNVLVFVLVDVVNDGRQGSTFARTGGPRNQNHTVRLRADILGSLAHTKLFHRQYLGGNGTEYCTGTAILIRGVYPKAGQPWNFEGKVGLKQLFVVLALLIVHHLVNQLMYVFMLHRGKVDTSNIAVNSNHRWQTGRQVKVRGTLLDRKGQKFGNIHRC